MTIHINTHTCMCACYHWLIGLQCWWIPAAGCSGEDCFITWFQGFHTSIKPLLWSGDELSTLKVLCSASIQIPSRPPTRAINHWLTKLENGLHYVRDTCPDTLITRSPNNHRGRPSFLSAVSKCPDKRKSLEQDIFCLMFNLQFFSLHYVLLHNVQNKYFDWTRGIPDIPVDRITALGLTLCICSPHRFSNHLIKPNPTSAS